MSRHHSRNGFVPSFRCLAWGVLAPVAAVVLLCGHAQAGLIINATFDTSITSLPGAAAIEGAINAAVGVLEADISTNITVAIDFQNMNSGLGSSESGIYTVSYFDFYNQLKAVATSPAQLMALASLGTPPTSGTSGNPVNGNISVAITAPEGRSLGFNTPGVVPGPGGKTFDTIIGLNTSLTFPPNSPASAFYGLQSVAAHELNEALGIGGTGSTLSGTGNLGGPVGDLDLFRYSAPGVRSYSNTQTTSPFSYFSIDGGKTVLSYFNQTTRADFGDWLSNPIPSGFQPQVQDAFGTVGTNPALGVNELTALNAIGYGLTAVSAVPEPSSLMMLGTAVLVASGGYGWSRRKERRGKAIA